MASTLRRGLKVSDENVKLISSSASQKSMPAILSRKRKSDHLDMVINFNWPFSSLLLIKRRLANLKAR